MPIFETSSSQLGLIGGIRQATSAMVLVAEPASPFTLEARKGRLYLLVEAERPGGRIAEAVQEVTRVLRQAFYDDDSLSVTSSLRAAIHTANKALYNLNIRTGQPVTLGLTCAVLKDEDLFVAQIAPASSAIFSEGRVRMLPHRTNVPPVPTTLRRPKGVGVSLFVESDFFRATLHSGDALLLVTTTLGQQISAPLAAELLTQNDPATAIDRLQSLCADYGLNDAHALVVRVATPDAHIKSGMTRRGRGMVRRVGAWLGYLTGEATLALRRRPRSRVAADAPVTPKPDPLKTMPTLSDLPVNPTPRPRPLELGENLAEMHQAQRREPPTSTYLGELSPPAIDLGDPPPLNPRIYRSRIPLRPPETMTWSERLTQPFLYVLDAIEDVTRRPRRPPPPSPHPRDVSRGLSYRHYRTPFPWLLLFTIALLVTSLILYGINLSTQADQQRATEYLDQATERMAAVNSSTTEADAFTRLDGARQALDQLRASALITETQPTFWLRYLELQREYERLVASVQRQTYFEEATILSSHPITDGHFISLTMPTFTGATTDTDALEALGFLYALDAGKDTVHIYRIPRDGGPAQPYLSSGDTVQTTLVGTLRSILWRVDNIVAVDQAQSGFGYYFRSHGEWNYTRLGGSEIWRSRGRLDVETYDGNLYVWGANAQELLKYSSGHYGDPPLPWIDPNALAGNELSNTVDMAVDGNIYLLLSDGRVLIFSAGQFIHQVKPDAIEPPISAVTRFVSVGGAEDGWFFLLDSLNERVIQVEKSSGRVVQQIIARPGTINRLDQLADLQVELGNGKPIIYLVNGGQIIRAQVPTPPQPLNTPTSATR